ncbi:MAG: dihydroorotate dehydrogenase [Acidobacteria bacterium]|nr:MAG: dihydroorotate dehydrogenase [Acidobacteriota bacterium]
MPTSSVDLSVELGGLNLKNPVVAASGTFGTGMDLAAYVNPADLGAVTVKSLSAFPWEGNAPPRLKTTPGGMLNTVGLQNPGIDAWSRSEYPELAETGATIIASVWGRSPGEFAEAASLVSRMTDIRAIELNLSCPNLESSSSMFAHSSLLTGEVIRVVRAAIPDRDITLLAKLSPNTTELVSVATAAVEAGADALTLINTVLGMSIDPSSGRLSTSRAPAGLSGPAIRPIAVRCVHEVATALPDVPVIGTGGVTDGESAVEMMRAGATAVGVGTASFFDPRATTKIVTQLQAFCRRHRVTRVSELTGALDTT